MQKKRGLGVSAIRWLLLIVWISFWLVYLVWLHVGVGYTLHIILVSLFFLWLFSFIPVVVYRWLPPYITSISIGQFFRNMMSREWEKLHKRVFLPIGRISPNLYNAVNISEENGYFMHHKGFNITYMIRAYRSNEAGNSLRGASTISQQTAKNIFLFHARTWTRKIIEAYYTVLIEMLWGKMRIMECYLNVVEYGKGIYGCEAASQYYFSHSASELTPLEAAMLVASLPAPQVRNPFSRTEKYNEHVERIMKIMDIVPAIEWGVPPQAFNLDNEVDIERSLFFFLKWLILHKSKKQC